MERIIKCSDKPLDALKDFLSRGFIKPDKALEISCGAGADCLFLAKKRFRVTGIDESQTLVNFAKHSDKTGRCRFLKKGALPLEFSSRSFSFILDKTFFSGLRKQHEDYVREVYRVLDVNGKLLVSILTKETPKFSIKSIINKDCLGDREMQKLFGNYFEIRHTHEKELENETILKSYLMEKK